MTRLFLIYSDITGVLFLIIFYDYPLSKNPISLYLLILEGLKVPSLTFIFSTISPLSFFFVIKLGIVKWPNLKAAVEKILVTSGSVSRL